MSFLPCIQPIQGFFFRPCDFTRLIFSAFLGPFSCPYERLTILSIYAFHPVQLWPVGKSWKLEDFVCQNMAVVGTGKSWKWKIFPTFSWWEFPRFSKWFFDIFAHDSLRFQKFPTIYSIYYIYNFLVCIYVYIDIWIYKYIDVLIDGYMGTTGVQARAFTCDCTLVLHRLLWLCLQPYSLLLLWFALCVLHLSGPAYAL